MGPKGPRKKNIMKAFKSWLKWELDFIKQTWALAALIVVLFLLLIALIAWASQLEDYTNHIGNTLLQNVPNSAVYGGRDGKLLEVGSTIIGGGRKKLVATPGGSYWREDGVIEINPNDPQRCAFARALEGAHNHYMMSAHWPLTAFQEAIIWVDC
jgi:hypothetical protein